MPKSRSLNVANMSLSAIRENKILAKFTVSKNYIARHSPILDCLHRANVVFNIQPAVEHQGVLLAVHGK